MPRPPVDTRLQNIEKSQQKIEEMLEKALEQEINSNDSTKEDVASVEKIDCKCKNITEEHKKRIDFAGQYDSIITQAASKKFIDQVPDRFRKETIDRLHFIQKDVPEGPMKIHALNDINKVIDWLVDLKFRENKK